MPEATRCIPRESKQRLLCSTRWRSALGPTTKTESPWPRSQPICWKVAKIRVYAVKGSSLAGLAYELPALPLFRRT